MLLYLKSALYALLIPGVVIGVIPWGISEAGLSDFEVGAYRWLGLAPMVPGVLGLLWCVYNFASFGRGTLVPIDAPRRLVIVGLYRILRNPMYVSNLCTLAGEGLLLQSWAIWVWGLILAIGWHLFVVFYEEPTLKRKFGADYEAYVARVPRWIPRRPA